VNVLVNSIFFKEGFFDAQACKENVARSTGGTQKNTKKNSLVAPPGE